MEYDFSKKCVLITGGSSGIGKGIASVFSRLGAAVAIIGRSSRIFRAAEEMGPNVAPYQADVSRFAELRAVMEDIQRDIGPVDVLVNNAGIAQMCRFLDLTDDMIQRHYAVNVLGAMYCSRLVLPAMVKRRWGRVINISSVTGPFVADPGHSAYAVTKAALIGLTKALAVEFAPYGITVNAICPGYVRMEMSVQSAKAVSPQNYESILASIAAGVPLKRLGTPEEIGEIAAFLAGRGGSYMTGQALVVDGGRSTVETSVMELNHT